MAAGLVDGLAGLLFDCRFDFGLIEQLLGQISVSICTQL
jgi:hypothetical protein